MQAIIPGRFHKVIQAAVASGRYASGEDAILAAITQWAQAEEQLQVASAKGLQPAAGRETPLIGPEFDAWLDRAYATQR